jgi:hypothetical protein
VMALTVIGALSAKYDGTGSGSSQTTSGNAASGNEASNTAQTPTIGQVARDGDFAFVVEGIRCGPAEAQAVYNDPDITGTLPAGTKECIVKLQITDDKNVAQQFFRL